MAARAAAGPLSPRRPSPPSNDIDDYDVDDDIFAESGGDESAQKNGQSKKRKDAASLGIDEEVAVVKKIRAPMVKLDENRLLSEKGIPRLRRKARDLKFKGKGHEFSDAARLLSFYQLWLDDLFPKAKFLDALVMVEKAGHKKHMHIKRMEWINEGKPKPHRDEDDEDIFGESNQPEEREASNFPARVAPIFQNRGSQRPKTPTRDDLFGDEDIYDATPRAPRITGAAGVADTGKSAQPGEMPDDDDLDALMAEEEVRRTAPTNSIFGSGTVSWPPDQVDEDDLDALMAEAEAQANQSRQNNSTAPKPRPSAAADEEDDLDALMAEAEASSRNPQQRDLTEGAGPPPQEEQSSKGHVADADEEEAMAEMDGLW
ncbi:hypothetical protein DL766_005988 [Monosporascus sp. MC13-8B]|uniref:Chromosome segregation in meiosis protein n=1 Tax=Monosporascus cannonballus TaxID=155416 RepID=A0ABY0H7X4_9PEZI|nr:hypothetical protein DL762_004485 [Monosporascus cannonballus]RYO94691.1 hypothetical protein DL763_003965 [Monosporascus cannonballus]RYP28243.1 hypothetical protein DL766_005988 [Monosporascus sp. MC13-8B]